jgi:alcohol dehydrogenase class IV
MDAQIPMVPNNGGELRKFVVPEIVFGLGSIDLAGRYVRNFMGRKALVVSDRGVMQAGWLGRVLKSLGKFDVAYDVFTELTCDPKACEVAKGAERYRESGCDVIVVVGGGSPMDCAKGIGVSVANDADVLKLAGAGEISVPGPPLICIPTTAGSSADVSQFMVITDEVKHLKIPIASKVLVPDVSLIDPQTTLTMSETLTAHTGVDAMVHAIEAYVSNAHSPLTDLHALEAIRILSRHLPDAVVHRDDLELKSQIMLASLYAGLAFSNASLGLVHAMAHSFSIMSGLSHGLSNGLLLESVVEFNYPACSDRYDRIAETMGGDISSLAPEGRLGALLKTIGTFLERCGLKAEMNISPPSPEVLALMVERSLNDACIVTNPCYPSSHDIEVIYGQVFRRSEASQ